MSRGARGGLAIAALVIAMVLLHQDTWQWRDPRRVLFGLLPVGLAWHVGFAGLSSIVMAALVRFAWPAELDADEPAAAPEPRRAGPGGAP